MLDEKGMFTGIVEKIATVAGVADGPGFRRLALALNVGGSPDWPKRGRERLLLDRGGGFTG